MTNEEAEALMDSWAKWDRKENRKKFLLRMEHKMGARQRRFDG
jgi:hypothetical protein